MFLEHGRHRLVAAGALVAALAFLAACSGGDDAGPLTAAQADTIADEALLAIGDLPEGDWEQDDAQTGLAGLVPNTGGVDVDFDLLPEACQVLEDAIGNLPALLGDTTPLATSSRSFTAAGQLLNLQAVSTSVVVFEEADGARQAAALLEDSFSPDSLEGCIQASVAPIGDGAGIQIVDFSLSTPIYALDDSTALTATIDAIALIIPINISVDLHAFQRDNVLALYVGLEVNSSALAGEHAALLATFANRIAEAQSSAR